MSQNSKQHYYWLDCLRVLSAFIVVFGHARCNFFQIYCNLEPSSKNITSQIFYFITSWSDEAVLIFFILSGFLVGGKAMEDIWQKKNINTGIFFISRFTRILLPLAGALLLFVIVYHITGEPTDYGRLVGNLFSLQGVYCKSEGGILWTMPYVVWFYVLIFAIILLYCRKSKSGILLGFILLVVSLSFFIRLTTHSFLFVISMGILAFYLKNYKLPMRFNILFLLTAIAMVFLTKFVKPSMSIGFSLANIFNLDILKFVEGTSFAVLISQLVRYVPKKAALIKFDKICGFFASFSYTLYLTHIPTTKLLLWLGFPRSSSLNLTSFSFYIVAVLICIVIAYLMYLLVERNTDKIKKYLIAKFVK